MSRTQYVGFVVNRGRLRSTAPAIQRPATPDPPGKRLVNCLITALLCNPANFMSYHLSGDGGSCSCVRPPRTVALGVEWLNDRRESAKAWEPRRTYVTKGYELSGFEPVEVALVQAFVATSQKVLDRRNGVCPIGKTHPSYYWLPFHCLRTGYEGSSTPDLRHTVPSFGLRITLHRPSGRTQIYSASPDVSQRPPEHALPVLSV